MNAMSKRELEIKCFLPGSVFAFIDRSNTDIGRCVCVSEQETMGFFHLQKNFGQLLLEISVWEERVPFVTSSIRGRPGRLKDCERYGAGDKHEKSVNGHKFPLESLHRENRNSVYSGTFLVERTKKSCSSCIPTGIS